MDNSSFDPVADDVQEQYVDVIDDRPLVARRPLDDSEMDITPMIDITFLLLIFFLVAARLDETRRWSSRRLGMARLLP